MEQPAGGSKNTIDKGEASVRAPKGEIGKRVRNDGGQQEGLNYSTCLIGFQTWLAVCSRDLKHTGVTSQEQGVFTLELLKSRRVFTLKLLLKSRGGVLHTGATPQKQGVFTLELKPKQVGRCLALMFNILLKGHVKGCESRLTWLPSLLS